MRNQSVRSYTQRIEAPPEVVSPLICPVREGQWLDGWADGFELIYSASEFAEKNCLFRTYGHGEPEMTWTVSEHDQARGVVEFVRVMTGLAACTLRVTIGDGGDGTSAVGIVYVITPVSHEGERVAAARYGSEELLGSVRWWGPHSATTCVPVNACADRRRTDGSAQIPGLAPNETGRDELRALCSPSPSRS